MLEHRRRGFVQPPIVATLLCAQGLLKAPLDNRCGSRGVLGAFSLSLSLLVEEGICLPLEVRQESWPNFKGITKGK